MTRARTHSRRPAFTLVELLVGMAIILALAGLTLLVYPGARDQDRVRQTVTDVGAVLKQAQGMAFRDKAPRGVRFLVGLDPNNIDKTDPRWVTELQYIEQPPPLVPNRNPLTSGNPLTEPQVVFRYTFSAIGPTNAQAGTVTSRQCVILNLPPDQAALIQPGCTLVMRDLAGGGAWSKITAAAPPPASFTPAPATGTTHREVTLEVYPDATLGASTHANSYNFAVYLPAAPIIGEPTVLLPKDVCVDLNPSVGPSKGGAAADFDVVFGPDGKLVSPATGQIFLWVRNYTKPAPYTTAPSFQFLGPTTTPTLADAMRRGGDQYILAIRSSGVLGNNEVAIPDGTGNFPNNNPYALAQQDLRQ